MTCVVRRCPKGLGAPVFDKLEAELSKALMSLPASKARPCHACCVLMSKDAAVTIPCMHACLRTHALAGLFMSRT